MPNHEAFPSKLSRHSALACTVTLATLCGCKSVPTVSPAQQKIGVEQSSAMEMQVRIHEFAGHFAVMIDQATGEIRARTGDPVVRKEALGVRMRSIAAVMDSAYLHDPLIATLDTWVLVIQMRDLTAGESGWNKLGEYQPILTDTMKSLERDIEEIVRSTTTEENFQIMNRQVENWVDEFPLDPSMGRRSILPLFAELYPKRGKGTFSAVRGMESTMSDLSDQLSAHVRILPFQARWQAEYLIEDLLQRDDFASLLENTVQLTDALQGATPLLEQAPYLIAREREAVLEAVSEEREAVLTGIDAQRIDTIEELRRERIAVIEALTAERIATLNDIARERDTTMVELEALTLKLFEEAGASSQRMIDYLFYKTMMLLAATAGFILAAGFLGLLGLRWVLRGLGSSAS